MAQLIQMRQRIKAIETIKKVTHAMRLISMSSHSRLRHTIEPLGVYRHQVESLLSRVRASAPKWTHPLIGIHDRPTSRHLVILIGSQKGLCGSFNTNLFARFAQYRAEYPAKNLSIIAIGKRAVDHAREVAPQQIVEMFPEFNPRTVGEIAQILTRYISKHAESLGYVDIVSNEFVNFFIQRPQAHTVVPIVEPETQNMTPEDYLWEMPSGEVLDMLLEQYLESTLLHFLYQSLLAEQAARFLSMDNSTRNAQTLLEDTQLQYNKLRQAIITKELTELAASFQPY